MKKGNSSSSSTYVEDKGNNVVVHQHGTSIGPILGPSKWACNHDKGKMDHAHIVHNVLNINEGVIRKNVETLEMLKKLQ